MLELNEEPSDAQEEIKELKEKIEQQHETIST